MKSVKEHLFINASPKKVYLAYADINVWEKAIDNVVGVKSYYNDSIHQEFDMTVEKDGKRETVHSIRFCFPCHSIEIFQTTPPPSLRYMSGVWRFENHNGGTLLIAERLFEPKKGVTFDEKILRSFLKNNLKSFKVWVERHEKSTC